MKSTRLVIPTLEGRLDLDREQYFETGVVAYRRKRDEGGWQYYSQERALDLFEEWHKARYERSEE